MGVTLFQYHVFVAEHRPQLTDECGMYKAACGESLFGFGEMYHQLFGTGEHDENELEPLVFLVIRTLETHVEGFAGGGSRSGSRSGSGGGGFGNRGGGGLYGITSFGLGKTGLAGCCGCAFPSPFGLLHRDNRQCCIVTVSLRAAA